MTNTYVLRKQVLKFVENASQEDLRLIYNLFQLNKQTDWWNEINKDHQNKIRAAINDVDKGKVIPHAKMVKNYSKWLKK